ncbi:MAG TPA: hypothetical protein PKA27_15265 [Fimbriimonadaceae bacterium]|nr:hypothetical protein [Fimbriimonadaceae bacterium]
MALPIVLAGIGIAFGIGSGQVRTFERLAADDIHKILQGESRVVSVKSRLNGVIGGALGDLSRVTIAASHFKTDTLPLYTEPDLSRSGKVRELRIELKDFVLAGLRCESLVASIPDCRFDYGLATRQKKIRLSESGVGTGTVKLLEEDLAAFILRKFKEIKTVSVQLLPDKAVVKGYGEFLIINTNFHVEAQLGTTDGSDLILTNCDIRFDGRQAEANAARVLLDTLNPVVELDKDLKLLDAVKVKGVKIRKGYLEAWGDTKIPIRPR